jgi:hypothetical protein
MADGAPARARELWDAGMQASLIAAEMGHGCTKSALLGFAHRQGWPKRPNPAGEVSARTPPKPHHKPGKRGKVVRAIKLPPPPPPAPPVALGKVRRCAWATSAGRPWTFCSAPVVAGCSWCIEHRARAYAHGSRASA